MKKLFYRDLMVIVLATGIESHGQQIQELINLAKGGDAQAQRNLGDAYEWGKGVDRDYAAAAQWYRAAAEQGQHIWTAMVSIRMMNWPLPG
jgi:hypothetical protein